jgi:hypothetical protein
MHKRMMMASNSKAPTTEPTTMPATCPPVRPDWDLLPDTAAPVADGEVVLELVKMLPIVVVMGSFTLAQRVVAWE